MKVSIGEYDISLKVSEIINDCVCCSDIKCNSKKLQGGGCEQFIPLFHLCCGVGKPILEVVLRSKTI